MPSRRKRKRKHPLRVAEKRLGLRIDTRPIAYYDVSRFTVRSWRLKGVGPKFLKMGRAVRYRSQDVDEYERQALVETQADADHSPM